MHWLRQAFVRAFDYSGRSRRMEYWSYALFTFVVIAIVGFVEQQLGLGNERKGGPLGAIAFFGLAIPGLAVAVRRLHDSDRAGWWVAMPVAPILFWAVAIVGRFNSEILFRITMVAILLTPVALLALMCIPGTKGSNRFGPDPKPENVADTFG